MAYKISSGLGKWLLFGFSIILGLVISEIIVRRFFDYTVKVIYKGDPIGVNNSFFKLSDNPILLYEPRNLPQVPKNNFRIIVLGDSITAGGRMGFENAYPKFLEVLLNRNSNNLRYEVINAGVVGYNTVQEAEYLEKRLIKYAPNVIIVGYCINDRAVKRRIIKYKDGLYCCDVVMSYPYLLDFSFNKILLNKFALYRFINF